MPGRSFLVGWLQRAEPKGRAACVKVASRVAASESGSGPGPSRRKSGVRLGASKRAKEWAAGQWPEPMGEWSMESEGLGLVRLKGRGVPGEVGRAWVTCRFVTGPGESHSFKQFQGPDGPGRTLLVA